jgi:hypothetical protein
MNIKDDYATYFENAIGQQRTLEMVMTVAHDHTNPVGLSLIMATESQSISLISLCFITLYRLAVLKSHI